MRSLAVRLTAVFLAVLIALGGFGVWVAERAANAYFLELTQRLNAPIAMYMAERVAPLHAGGIDHETLTALAEDVMTINPSVEVYVLDVEGRVVAQASTANRIDAPRVALGPIREFLTGIDSPGRALPLGDNPLAPGERRPFSAHPIVDGGERVGYVYAVLAGRQYRTLLASVRSSHSLRALLLTFGGALVLAALGGSIVFFMLTRRLRRLTRRVERWRDEELERQVGADGAMGDAVGTVPVTTDERAPSASRGRRGRTRAAPRRAGDEIDSLARAYDDMTARLRAQYRALAEADRTRRELFAGVSHDLRTPLTTLQGYLETLRLKGVRLAPELGSRYLSIAHRQCRQLKRLVDELFELSRLDSGAVELASERFSLLELAHDALQDIGIAAARRRVTLEVIPSEAPPGRFDVEADIALVQRVFENLLGNALRYVADGGRIAVGLERAEDGWVRVGVADDGRGMREEDLARVFEARFSDGGGGERAGLGLAIVSGIVALHGGTIDVESGPGLGTAFAFTLPAASAPPGRAAGGSGTGFGSEPARVR